MKGAEKPIIGNYGLCDDGVYVPYNLTRSETNCYQDENGAMQPFSEMNYRSRSCTSQIALDYIRFYPQHDAHFLKCMSDVTNQIMTSVFNLGVEPANNELIEGVYDQLPNATNPCSSGHIGTLQQGEASYGKYVFEGSPINSHYNLSISYAPTACVNNAVAGATEKFVMNMTFFEPFSLSTYGVSEYNITYNIPEGYNGTSISSLMQAGAQKCTNAYNQSMVSDLSDVASTPGAGSCVAPSPSPSPTPVPSIPPVVIPIDEESYIGRHETALTIIGAATVATLAGVVGYQAYKTIPRIYQRWFGDNNDFVNPDLENPVFVDPDPENFDLVNSDPENPENVYEPVPVNEGESSDEELNNCEIPDAIKPISDLIRSFEEDLSCLISQDVIKGKPFITPTGQSYEEKNIKKWLVEHGTNPVDPSANIAENDIRVNNSLDKLLKIYQQNLEIRKSDCSEGIPANIVENILSNSPNVIPADIAIALTNDQKAFENQEQKGLSVLKGAILKNDGFREKYFHSCDVVQSLLVYSLKSLLAGLDDKHPMKNPVVNKNGETVEGKEESLYPNLALRNLKNKYEFFEQQRNFESESDLPEDIPPSSSLEGVSIEPCDIIVEENVPSLLGFVDREEERRSQKESFRTQESWSFLNYLQWLDIPEKKGGSSMGR